MKNLFIIYILFIFCISCNNKNVDNEPDLSFAGITIGKEFPDSLKPKYKFWDTDIPQYEGLSPFDLPNNPNTSLSVIAVTDLKGEEVICIGIGGMNIEQSGEFFEMLKSKYGLPTSDYGNPDVKLDRFLYNIFSDLGYTYYNDDVDVSGDRILAVWKSVVGNSDIMMIGNTYHYPKDYRDNKPWTYVYFQYIDKDKYYTTQQQSEKNKINKKRENYRKNNSQYMNQDF